MELKEDLSLLTGRMSNYQKEFNEKLCKKVSLERAIKENRKFGDFKQLENEYMKLSSNPVEGHEDLLVDFEKRKNEMMEKEIKELKNKLENINRSIGNLRLEVKSKTSKINYNKWSLAIHESTNKIKGMFSKNQDDWFKMTMNREKTMNLIMKDIHRISTNMHSQQHKEEEEEEEKDNLILSVNEISSDSGAFNDSGFQNNAETSGNARTFTIKKKKMNLLLTAVTIRYRFSFTAAGFAIY